MEDVPAGTHTIQVAILGHLTLSQSVTVTAGAAVSVELLMEPDVFHIQGLVVTGTAFEESPVELPYAVSIAGRRTMAELGSPQAFDFFRNLTASQGILGARQGWYSTRPPGLVSETVASVNLRGLGASRTLVLLNGRRQVYIPVRLAGGRFVDVNAFPSIALDRIETVKEGASAVYGSDAVTGVVNFPDPQQISRGSRFPAPTSTFSGAGETNRRRHLGFASWVKAGARGRFRRGVHDAGTRAPRSGTGRWADSFRVVEAGRTPATRVPFSFRG